MGSVVTPKDQLDLMQRKHKRAMELRAEYIKQITNPHRHATNEGGTIFDAGLQRFQAMRVSNFEHFKPTGKSFKVGGFVVVLPIVLYAWWLKSDRDMREQKFRTGQVAYKDRQFKFI